jgi:HlyD family secretion protein
VTKRRTRRKSRTIERLVLTALLAATVGSAWRFHRVALAQAATEWWKRASGHVEPSHPDGMQDLPQRVVAEGRVAARPGAEVTLGFEIGGRVARVLIDERKQVHAGDVIAELDCQEQGAAAEEARAKLVEIDADIKLYESRLRRATGVSASGAISAEEVADRMHDLEAARARREAAAASLKRLESIVAKSQVRAPIDGTITARFVHPGQIIEPLTQVATIVDLRQTRLEAEVSEFDGGRVAIGAPATVTAEGYPGMQWRARVEEIPETVVSRRMRPDDPGRPMDTGVILVKLVLVDPAPFKLGQRVEVYIDPGRGMIASNKD